MSLFLFRVVFLGRSGGIPYRVLRNFLQEYCDAAAQFMGGVQSELESEFRSGFGGRIRGQEILGEKNKLDSLLVAGAPKGGWISLQNAENGAEALDVCRAVSVFNRLECLHHLSLSSEEALERLQPSRGGNMGRSDGALGSRDDGLEHFG